MGWFYRELPGKWELGVLILSKREKTSCIKSTITKFYAKGSHFLLFYLCFELALVKSEQGVLILNTHQASSADKYPSED